MTTGGGLPPAPRRRWHAPATTHPLRRRIHEVAGWLALALIITMTTLGCARGSPAGPAAPSVPPDVTAALSASGMQNVSPLRAFALHNTSLDALRRAAAQRVSNCMRDHGFTYTDPSSVAVFGLRGATLTEMVSSAREHGYGFADAASEERAAAGPPSDPNLRYAGSLAPARRQEFWHALTGAGPPRVDAITVPNDVSQIQGTGCLSTGLHATLDALPFFAEPLGDAVRRQIAEEARAAPMQRASWAWAACMHHRGYDLGTFGSAMPGYRSRIADLSVTAVIQRRSAEIVLASADADCYVLNVHPVQWQLERVDLAALRSVYPERAAEINRFFSATSKSFGPNFK